MKLSTHICFCLCLFGILPAQAQLNKEDSIRLKRMLEGEEEIIINQEAVKNIDFNFMPKAETFRNKPIMIEEKPWMKFIDKLPSEFIRRTIPYQAEMKLELDLTLPTLLPSTPLIGFDADKLLYETFTARGRAIKRNRKHANAWKIYNDYTPTQEDSLIWVKNKKRTPKDTLAIHADSIDENHFMNTK